MRFIAPGEENMDVAAVLDSLNAALRLQRRSVMEYLNAAGGGKGASALGVAGPLWDFAQAELADARLLVSKIVALGGVPGVDSAPLEFRAELEDALGQLIAHEEETLAAIHQVIPDTGQEAGSEALEHRVEHIIMRKQTQIDFLIRARG